MSSLKCQYRFLILILLVLALLLLVLISFFLLLFILRNFDFGAVRQGEVTLDDDRLAFLQPLSDFDLIARANADGDLALTRDVLGIDDHNRAFVGIARFKRDGRSRHDDRVIL